MKYIVHKRFKGKAICGYVNLPALTECVAHDGYIFHGDNVLCFETSENAHQYFAENEDSMGMIRGRLTQAIQKILSKRDDGYQARWDKVWDDEISQKYKRDDYDDFWLWNHEFFHASIEDLRHISHLVGVKEDA